MGREYPVTREFHLGQQLQTRLSCSLKPIYPVCSDAFGHQMARFVVTTEGLSVLVLFFRQVVTYVRIYSHPESNPESFVSDWGLGF